MTLLRLLIRNLTFHWRTNLAVLLGVIAGTAVIGGALVVGDSVRESLRQMTLERLGQIDYVLTSPRFFREELAGDAAPALFLTGSLEHKTEIATPRAGGVNIYGVDERFWNLTNHGEIAPPVEDEIVLNSRVAEQLAVAAGDEVTLWIELPATIPRESLLGEREELSQEIVLRVREVLDDSLGVSRFELNPNQQLPSNAFVALETLQQALGLEEVPATPRNPVAKPARVNALCAAVSGAVADTDAAAQAAVKSLNGQLAESWTLPDFRLRVVQNAEHGYVSLESEQMILEDEFAQAAQEAAKLLAAQLKLDQPIEVDRVLVYVANEFRSLADEDRFSRYSVVAGIEGPCSYRPRSLSGDNISCRSDPFSNFTFAGDVLETSFHSQPLDPELVGHIVIDEWLAEDLGVSAGDTVSVRYHVVGSHGELPEEERKFRVWGVVAMKGPAIDRGFTPEVQGITDVDSFAEWDAPFPMKPVTQRDDNYWDQYRATPKSFVSLDTAQQLWRSRYGKLTSVRIAQLPNHSLEETAWKFEEAFLAALEPTRVGMSFQPVKFNGLQASSGPTDFSQLFIAFSFFLIFSATILIALLFRLGVERRGTSVGLLSAVGFTPKQVQWLFLGEGLVVVGIGGLLGVAAAVGYAQLMVAGLKSEKWWKGAIGTEFLYVFVEPVSLLIGFVISVAITSLAVWWALRQLRALSTRELLSGATERQLTVAAQQRRSRRSGQLGVGALIVAGLLLAALLAGLVPATEAVGGVSWQVFAFFVVGIALLTATLLLLAAWLDADRGAAVRGGGALAAGRLGLRNASRHRQRSVFTVALIASATFVIVAVAAGHRNPAVEEPDKDSGNGGFLLVAESSQPILANLNTTAGRKDLQFQVDDDSEAAKLLEKMQVVPFRVKPGEEASCLNLYHTRLPTILGVPAQMIERGGFKFADTPGDNPWKLLHEEQEPIEHAGRRLPVVPVLGDMNSLMFSLKKGIGDTIPAPNEQNPEFFLKVVGMFDGSVFQGVLLMSDENFRRWYPKQEGYRYFLIGDRRDEDSELALTKGEAAKLSDVLETELADFGFDAEPVFKRLQDFLAVQNTYLSTFQTLGGLGLMLGTLGLATVMLRNVLERRSELALLRAVGFRNLGIAGLVWWENAFLLLWGLLAGTASALLAMTPHLRSIGADVPWEQLGLILGGVFAVGLAAALVAVREAVRTPIVATLRSE